MPHYADGTEAEAGHQVVGKLYNSGPEEKAGTIISITRGVETCNAMVQFTEVRTIPEGELAPTDIPRMAIKQDHRTLMAREVLGEQHGSTGPRLVVYTCVDYCETRALRRVG